MISGNSPHSIAQSAGICFMLLALTVCNAPKSSDETAQADSVVIDTTQAVTSAEPVSTEVQPEAVVETETPRPGDVDYTENIKKCFTHEQANLVENAKLEFMNMQSASDMARYYTVLMPEVFKIVNERIMITNPDLYSGDDAPSEHWAWFADYYPAVQLSVDCGECMYEPSARIEQLKSMAARTTGTEDDLFMELVDIGETDSYQLIGCDFCAAYTLGDNRNSNMLALIEKASSATTLFGEQISQYRRDALAVTKEFYFYDKAKVLKELDLMLKSTILTAEERATLKETRDRLASEEPNAQFGCGSRDCDWQGVG